jgi:hypothetical protein
MANGKIQTFEDMIDDILKDSKVAFVPGGFVPVGIVAKDAPIVWAFDPAGAELADLEEALSKIVITKPAEASITWAQPIRYQPEEYSHQFHTDLKAIFEVDRTPPITQEEILSETTVDDLELVRQTLIERGWTQGTLRDDATGKVCLLGAVAATPLGHRQQVVRAALQLYLESLGQSLTIPSWNDRRGRTEQEALDFLSDAARWIKEKIND